MDISFPKYFEECSKTFQDNDSGYMSHHQESNNSDWQGIPVPAPATTVSESLYLNEDALLEKPESVTKTEETKAVYDEYSNQSYFHTIVDASVSTVKTSFSGMEDTDASFESETSPILTEQQPIVYVVEETLGNQDNFANWFQTNKETNNFTSKQESNTLLIEFKSPAKQLLENEHKISTPTKICDINNQNDFKKFKTPTKPADKKYKTPTKRNAENDFNAINLTENVVKTISPKKKRKRSVTPQKKIELPKNIERSPDLFSEDEFISPVKTPKFQNTTVAEKYVFTNDKKLVKKIAGSLSGVLPPPSLTTNHLSIDEILNKIKENDSYFWSDASCENKSETLLVNSGLDVSQEQKWPDILQVRYHGLHYNCSKVSEELESLCMKYSQRYVGSETQSSCTVFDNTMSSPFKRKANRLRWTAKSPGRRLSHLARRRITFSSANLQAGSSSSHSRQVMIDAKRFELLSRPKSSPKKLMKSPKKSIKTPSSSVKKKMSLRFTVLPHDDNVAGPSSSSLRASATKRALFQSPEKPAKLTKIVIPSTSNSALSPWKKRNTPKRALFNSPKNSPSKIGTSIEGTKRKRMDNDEPPCKFPRSQPMMDSTDVKPKKNERTKGDSRLSLPPVELSAHHKKKLQWAVYEALRGQNITVTHPQFKQFASVLARVTRRLLPNLTTGQKTEIGTSERMLRIAKQHVFSVTKCKTVEDIILTYEANRLKTIKPSGYVAKEEPEKKIDVSVARGSRDVFQDKANIINSYEKVAPPQPPARPMSTIENRVERVRKIINFDDDSAMSFR